MTVTDHKWFDHECQESGCQSLLLKHHSQKFLFALAAQSKQTAYAGDPYKYVEAVIDNLDEVNAVLPDSLNRGLIERITGLLERANREATLAVELRQRAEAAEAELAALRERERKLAAYCTKRSEENAKRSHSAEEDRRWHAGKADTYRRIAEKLKALSAAPEA